MNKKHIIIGIIILVAVLVCSFAGICFVTEQYRKASVEKLVDRFADIEHSYLDYAKQVKPIVDSSNPDVVHANTILGFYGLIDKLGERQSQSHWQKALELIDEGRWRDWKETDYKIVTEFLDVNRDIILDIRTLAASGGPFYVLDFCELFEQVVPQHPRIRDCVDLLTANITVEVSRSNYEEVVKDITAIIQLADICGKEPVFWSQMNYQRIISTIYGNVEQVVRGERLDNKSVKTVIRQISNSVNRAAFPDAYITEGIFGIKAFRNIETDNKHGNYAPSASFFLRYLHGSLLARPLRNIEEMNYIEITTRKSNAMQLPFYEAKPLLKQIDIDIENMPRYWLMAQTLLMLKTENFRIQAQYEARLGLLQIGLAIESYYGQHGEYPQTLDEIAPLFDDPIPLDPFTGQPFVYELHDKGFTLYSAMGSATDFTDHKPPAWADSHGNIVWRYDQESSATSAEHSK